MYRHFYASAALEIHTCLSNGNAGAAGVYPLLEPRHFNILRSRFQVIRWDTIYSGMMDRRLHRGEIAFFDETFMNCQNPVGLLEENAVFRSELLFYLRQVARIAGTRNTDDDDKENHPNA